MRRRVATASEQHAVCQGHSRNHGIQSRCTIACVREEQDGRDRSRRQSEPLDVYGGRGQGGNGDDGGEVSWFMRAMNGEGGVWRL